MNCPPCNGSCNQGRSCPAKPANHIAVVLIIAAVLLLYLFITIITGS